MSTGTAAPVRPEAPSGTRAVVVAALAPAAWLVHIAAMPALVPLSCEWASTWPLHLTTAVCAATAAVGVVLSHRARRRLAGVRNGNGDGALERGRYWSTWGVLVGWLFGVLILAEHIPVLVLSACPP